MSIWAERAEQERARAVEQLAAHFGIEGHLNRAGHIVIRHSDAERLKADYASYPAETPFPPGRGQLWGIPLEAAPDWTFDPASVAWARLIASVSITLRLRQIVRRLSRLLDRLSPALETPNV